MGELGAIALNQPIAAQHCEAHFSRVGIKVPAFRLGLCRACFLGKPLGPAEEVEKRKNARRVRRCSIQGCERRIYLSNRSGICSMHQKKGFFSEKERKRIREREHRYYVAHREKVLARGKRNRLANPEKTAARRRLHYEANRERIAVKGRRYYRANRKKVMARTRAYYKANRERILVIRRGLRGALT